MIKKKPEAIELDAATLERMKIMVSDTPNTLTHAHSRSGALVKPEDQGTTKGVAVTAMHQQTHVQLQQIAEQIQVLARQYESLKHRIEISERIYLAHIPFTPKIGQVYCLYAQEGSKDVLSLLNPTDWGARGMPYTRFLAKVRLLADHTWEVLEEGEGPHW